MQVSPSAEGPRSRDHAGARQFGDGTRRAELGGPRPQGSHGCRGREGFHVVRGLHGDFSRVRFAVFARDRPTQHVLHLQKVHGHFLRLKIWDCDDAVRWRYKSVSP